MSLIDYISVIGSYFSIVGVIFTLIQLKRTKEAAIAASNAVESVKSIIGHNVILTDISSGIQLVEEIKVHIRHKRYESGLLRVTDLISKLIQFEAQSVQLNTESLNSSHMITQLSILRELLEKKLFKSDFEIDNSYMNSVLSKISDELNVKIGTHKYATSIGE